MLFGAIIGDIVGSKYEFDNIRTKDFLFFENDMFFTDDTVMSIAVFEALKNTRENNYTNLKEETVRQLKKYGRMYPNCSYGVRFRHWLISDEPQPYNSYGNGSAMRISSVGYFANSIDEVKKLSRVISEVSHNHPEGVKGAEATAIAIYMALNKKSKSEIKEYIEKNYYSLDFEYEELVKNYRFNETCQDTVPQALYCFFISDSFEDAIRCGISIGGDSDTLCAIVGSIAEAYYGVDREMMKRVSYYLDDFLLEKLYDSQEFEKLLNKDILKAPKC